MLICLLFRQPAMAAESLSPLETIKGPFDRIIEILNAPVQNTQEAKQRQRDRIWKEFEPLVDFYELSRRAVGKKWNIFTKDEQIRFQKIFSEFLAMTYLDKIQGDYDNEKIVFISELVRDNRALARTKLVRESLEVPIDYRMKHADGKWKIYDVMLEEGVSLVKNYRVQFTAVLQKKSPSQLIQQLEDKMNAQKATSN
jgi:phospholipid transport system substrate-binding protein